MMEWWSDGGSDVGWAFNFPGGWLAPCLHIRGLSCRTPEIVKAEPSAKAPICAGISATLALSVVGGFIFAAPNQIVFTETAWMSIFSKFFRNKISAVTSPKHLAYESIEAWAEGERLPRDWMNHPDAIQRDLWFEELRELKQHLWKQHVATLPEDEQMQFEAGTHPSQSHAFQERAQPFVAALHDHLACQGYAPIVRVGLYHMDRLVLSVRLDRAPDGGFRTFPWLFRGFEVKYECPSPRSGVE